LNEIGYNISRDGYHICFIGEESSRSVAGVKILKASMLFIVSVLLLTGCAGYLDGTYHVI
jgi:hypothetical protein